MKKIKIISLIILGLLDLYCLYCSIGYFIIGNKLPKLIGDTTTIFTGSYIMSIMYFAFTLIISTLIIILLIKFKRKNT